MNLYCFWENLLKNVLRLQRAFFGLLLLTTVILWFRQMNWHCVEGDMSKNNYLGIPCWNWIFYNLFLPWEQNFHLTWFWTLLFIGCIPPVPATPILSTPKKERSQMEIGKKCGDPQKSEGPPCSKQSGLAPAWEKYTHKWESNHFGAKN